MFPLRSLLISCSCLVLVVGTVQITGNDRSRWIPAWSARVSGALVSTTIAAPLTPPGSPCESLAQCTQSCNLEVSPSLTPIVLAKRDPTLTLRNQGSLVCVNDRPLSLPWLDLESGEQSELALADFALADQLGLNLLDSNTPEQQPVDWFAVDEPSDQPADPPGERSLPLALGTTLSSAQRYLSLTPLVTQGGWRASVVDGILHLDIPPVQVQALRLGQQGQGYRAVLELDRPAVFTTAQESSPQGDRWRLVLEGSLADPFSQPDFATFLEQDPIAQRLKWQMQTTLPRLTASHSTPQTDISTILPPGLVPTVSRLSHPHRLVIDFQPRHFATQTIAWAEGITWQQRWIQVKNKTFAVLWLTLDPNQWHSGFQFRPLLPRTHHQTIAQLQPLPRLVADTGAIVAVNAGYFNRNNQLPLGAIRTGGDWISGPILNRGVIAWQPTTAGQPFFQFDRLRLEETVTIAGQPLPLTHLNSGYVKAGIARYTPLWGTGYTPLIDSETLLTVINDRLTQVKRSGSAQGETIPIPDQGYLLAARASESLIRQFGVGDPVELQQTTIPAPLGNYAETLGAGPLLVKNGRIVLDAAGEGFSTAFIQQAALRSALGQTQTGQLLIVTIASTPGGALPTLAELADLMLKLGAIDALNLDGGSSSSLYLGGKVLNRPPNTAARIHNGLGLVYQP